METWSLLQERGMYNDSQHHCVRRTIMDKPKYYRAEVRCPTCSILMRSVQELADTEDTYITTGDMSCKFCSAHGEYDKETMTTSEVGC
jgi:hypothetical protein